MSLLMFTFVISVMDGKWASLPHPLPRPHHMLCIYSHGQCQTHTLLSWIRMLINIPATPPLLPRPFQPSHAQPSSHYSTSAPRQRTLHCRCFSLGCSAWSSGPPSWHSHLCRLRGSTPRATPSRPSDTRSGHAPSATQGCLTSIWTPSSITLQLNSFL